MSTDIATRSETGALVSAVSVEAVLYRLDLIQQLMKKAMIQGVDYGIIPGTQSKPTLLKPGAEKLAVMFRLCPRYKTEKHFHPDGHLTVESTCQILDNEGTFLGEASAMCSTKEAKYRYRGGARLCPECGKPTIKKSKYPPRDDPDGTPGFYCFAKQGGCGANFAADDERITSQSEQKVENPDLADSYNTVLRIAEKRSLLGAIRLVTGSSALFDEEIPGVNEGTAEESPAPKTNGKKKPAPRPEPLPEDPEVTRVRQWWVEAMAKEPLPEDVNTKAVPEIRLIVDKAQRAAAWTVVRKAMEERGYRLNGTAFELVPPPQPPEPLPDTRHPHADELEDIPF